MADKKEDDKQSAAAQRPAANGPLRGPARLPGDLWQLYHRRDLRRADLAPGILRDAHGRHETDHTGLRPALSGLVLAPVTAVDLINRMQQVGAALTKAGIVKANPPAGEK